MEHSLPKPSSPPVRLILNPWLADSGLTMIHGKAGVGKSYFLMAMAEAITRAKPTEFLGWKIREQAGVLLVDGEMPAPTIQERAKRVGLWGRENFWVLPCIEVSRRKGKTISLADSRLRATIGALILETPARVVIIDNLASLAAVGDENDSGAWSEINAWLLNLRAAGKSVILVHHSNKAGGQRGTSHREDNLDTIIRLDPNGDQQVRVRFDKARNFGGAARAPRSYRMDVEDDTVTLSLAEDIDREVRHEGILADLEKGLKHKDIAERHDVSRSLVSKINSKRRKIKVTEE